MVHLTDEKGGCMQTVSDLIDELCAEPSKPLVFKSDFSKIIEDARMYNADFYKKRYGDKPTVVTVPSYICPHKKCDGTGLIVTAYPPNMYYPDYPYSLEIATKCVCNGGKEASEFRKLHSMIPFEYLDKRGKDFKWNLYNETINEQKSIVNSFILKFNEFDKQGKGLYIYSTTKGSGKTFLACCIANELSEKGINVKFINVLDLIELSKRSFSSDEYRDEVDTLFNSRVLIIDDLGCEKGSDWFNNLFLRLVNTRHGKKRIIIYTSNIYPDKLKIDDRVSSRIQEASINIKLPDECIRSKLAREKNDEFLKAVMAAEHT